MVDLALFVITRWQSKFYMLRSLVANKPKIRAMCASGTEECKALHDQDLSDIEWKMIEVRAVLLHAIHDSSRL